MSIPFIPTPEQLAESNRLRAERQAAAAAAQSAAVESHTQSTGSPTPSTAVASSPAPVTPPAPGVAASHTQSSRGFPAPVAAPSAAPASRWPAPAPAIPGQPPPPRPPLAPCVLTAAQLASMIIPPRPALLDRWLCQGDLGYIYAPRGVGKTWMAMAVPGAISTRSPLGLWQAGDPAPEPPEPSASSCASPSTPTSDPAAPSSDSAAPIGLDFAPAPDPSHVPILYVDGEMSLKHTQCRSQGLQLMRGHVDYLHHEHLFELQERCINIGEAEDRQRITDLVLQRGYRVLILDNLSSLASGIDENKGMDYEPIANWLLDLRRRKITVIMVHHAGRSGLMRGHSKREDACAWIIELRDARQENDPGAKFVSHFAKPSRNTGDPLPDMLWHFITDKKTGITDITCELAINSEYEQFIQHVCEGVTVQIDIAEMMNRPRGTISKWATKALKEGRLTGSPRHLLPPGSQKSAAAPTKSWHDEPDSDEDDEP